MTQPPSGDRAPSGGGVAVLAVDVQRDFCAGGALAVPDGDQVVPALNRLLDQARRGGRRVYATRDWHPPDSHHFVTGGGRWPVHCVAGTEGARFHRNLQLPEDVIVVSKGTEPNADGYSAFDGRLADGTPLDADLIRRGITRLLVGGLATDYCVQASVLDALRWGAHVTLLTDAIAAVDLEPGDGARAVEAMRAAGAELGRTIGLRLE